MEKWTWLLVQLNEPPLQASGDSPSAFETYRVLWIPSFRPVVAVRVERGDQAVSLTRVIQRRESPERREADLPLEVWRTGVGTLGDEAFWRVPRAAVQGLDGETWLLECRTASGYQHLESWCPGKQGRDADILANGEALVALAARAFGAAF